MATDEQGRSKGFAFIEFEQEVCFVFSSSSSIGSMTCVPSYQKKKDALNALNANNYELKSRRIAVTMADTRVRARRK